MFILLFGMAALVLQVTSWAFLIPGAYKPDLIMILVLWASLRMSFVIGVGFAYTGGMAVDLLSGSPVGLFAIIYCLLFVVCDYLNSNFRMDDLQGRAVTVFGSTLIAAFIVLCVRRLAGPVEVGRHLCQWVVLKSMIAATASLPIFALVDRAWTAYSRLARVP